MVPVFEDLLKIIKHFLNILHKMCYSIKFYLLIYLVPNNSPQSFSPSAPLHPVPPFPRHQKRSQLYFFISS